LWQILREHYCVVSLGYGTGNVKKPVRVMHYTLTG